MKRNSGTAAAILDQLAAGPLTWNEFAALTKRLPGGRMAASRMKRRGLIEDGVRLTPAGRRERRAARESA